MVVLEVRLFASGQNALGGHRAEHVQSPCNDARPACLMARAKPGAVIAVEVFVEQQAVAPVRILLKFLGPAVDGAAPVAVLEKNVREPGLRRCEQSRSPENQPRNKIQRRNASSARLDRRFPAAYPCASRIMADSADDRNPGERTATRGVSV